ncbi:MAG: carbon-nitrogen hydrolase family protein [Acidobacteriota bacterium]
MKKLRIYIPFILILLSVAANNALAANYITVAAIGAAPSMDKNQDPQKLVDQVIEFWKHELKQVLPDKPDLIVLPEFCDLSGAGNEYLRVRKNQVLDYFASVAKYNRCYLAFGMRREESEGVWRNSCVILDRSGVIAGIYDKNFPTIGEMENGIKAGKEAPVFQCDFGSVAVAICFDLNFDELREEYVNKNPDLILFPSMYHGGLVQSNWAYTCRSHFIGALHKGTPSEIRNPLGEVIATNTNYFDFTVARINLDCKLVHLDYNWSKLTALKEKYGASVTITDPGKLASVLIASEDENITIDQMIREFDIEILDNYLNRARAFRLKKGNMQ